MEDFGDIPDESLRHIEALLSRHPPNVILRMFNQVAGSRRVSTSSSTSSSQNSIISRISSVSSFSTTGSSYAPSIASSTSTRSARSSRTRQEPRSYPHGLHQSPLAGTSHTPTSEMCSPIDGYADNVSIAPTESIASPSVAGGERGGQGSESYWFCTFCPDLKTFCAKSDWKKHEMRMHETGEDWPCPVPGCRRIFDREKDFLRHCQRYHPGRQLPPMNDIRIQLLERKVFGCGFDNCKDFIIGWDDRCNHVADHMKRGKTFVQWKYANVIRNLIRQDATRDTWKELLAHMDDAVRRGRSHISWCPDNTRILKQKLECCDLRPSREEVLLTALALRSDIPMDPACLEPPDQFVTPSRDSVPPNFSTLSSEARMRILNGNSSGSFSRSRFNLIASAMSKALGEIPLMQPTPPSDNYVSTVSSVSTAPSFVESTMSQSTMSDTNGRRISWMDVDMDSQHAQMEMHDQIIPPSLPTHVDPQHAHLSPQPQQTPEQTGAFVDPGKSSNPLLWAYPTYFDAAPAFEQSQYYNRPSLTQIISKPIKRVKSGLNPSKRAHQNQATPPRNNPVPPPPVPPPAQPPPPPPPQQQLPALPQHQQHAPYPHHLHHQMNGIPMAYHNPDGSMDPMRMFSPQA